MWARRREHHTPSCSQDHVRAEGYGAHVLCVLLSNSSSQGPQGKILFLHAPSFLNLPLSTEQLANRESLTQAHR